MVAGDVPRPRDHGHGARREPPRRRGERPARPPRAVIVMSAPPPGPVSASPSRLMKRPTRRSRPPWRTTPRARPACAG
ncbi:MAG: hypothetical protein E6H03_07575 [Bacillati bacterium ANGP1]|uniref:Uncharacterized protein n=1 Tax=Candidatus Segetimicrobium genomatis TaxID=2569760 RepID=A0A537JBP9_9BACT|nr:MAG: hypothetical protein E6H03_07575 [Terrabacteria group bacterium ANGP1]